MSFFDRYEMKFLYKNTLQKGSDWLNYRTSLKNKGKTNGSVWKYSHYQNKEELEIMDSYLKNLNTNLIDENFSYYIKY